MILMLLERILAFSEEQELLPTVKRTKVHPKTIPFEKDLLSPEALSLLSRHLVEADTAFAAGVLLCMYTGIRIGELCGIKGADIDLKRGILTIRGRYRESQIPTFPLAVRKLSYLSARQNHCLLSERYRFRIRSFLFYENGPFQTSFIF